MPLFQIHLRSNLERSSSDEQQPTRGVEAAVGCILVKPRIQAEQRCIAVQTNRVVRHRQNCFTPGMRRKQIDVMIDEVPPKAMHRSCITERMEFLALSRLTPILKLTSS